MRPVRNGRSFYRRFLCWSIDCDHGVVGAHVMFRLSVLCLFRSIHPPPPPQGVADRFTKQPRTLLEYIQPEVMHLIPILGLSLSRSSAGVGVCVCVCGGVGVDLSSLRVPASLATPLTSPPRHSYPPWLPQIIPDNLGSGGGGVADPCG